MRLTAVEVLVACAALLYAFFYAAHRLLWHTGRPARTYHTVTAAPEELEQSVNAPQRDGDVVAYQILSGDLGAALIAHEVLDARVHYQHGVGLHARPGGPPPLVVDIGANIGLFALSVARDYPSAVVAAVEPVLALCRLARANCADYAERVTVVHAGLGAAEGEAAYRTPFRIAAGASSRQAEVSQPLRQVPWAERLAAIGRDYYRAGTWPYFPTKALCRGLSLPLVRHAVLLLLAPLLGVAALYWAAAPAPGPAVRCATLRLRSFLRRAADEAEAAGHGAAAARLRGDGPIDLLKVDVSGAELDVLGGIEDADWARVRQVVMEVHDLNGRRLEVRRLLAAKGFNHIVFGHQLWESHKLLHIESVYATRIEKSATPSPVPQ